MEIKLEILLQFPARISRAAPGFGLCLAAVWESNLTIRSLLRFPDEVTKDQVDLKIAPTSAQAPGERW
jgi:hypothetical protein